MWLSVTHLFRAVDKPVGRQAGTKTNRLKAVDYIFCSSHGAALFLPVHGLIHGSTLIHVIHGLQNNKSLYYQLEIGPYL